MKIVKLNRNFNIYKNHGFAVGIKFEMWDEKAQRYEQAAAKRLGNQSWSWKYHPGERIKENWASGFGKQVKGGMTPFWIYLRDENLLSLILLTVESES